MHPLAQFLRRAQYVPRSFFFKKEITAVTIFPPEITDVFGEETLEEAKGNPVTFIQNISSVYAYVIGPL